MSAHRHRRNYNPCFIQPLFGGRLLFLDRPQVGKPTWGYDYTTALRRLPSPSDCHHHRPQKTAPHRHAPMARCIAIAKNRRRAVSYVSTGLARLPRDTGGTRTTAEVRLYKKKKWNPASRWIPFLKKSYTPYFVNFKTVLSLNFNT